jgi:hypothetical protein
MFFNAWLRILRTICCVEGKSARTPRRRRATEFRPRLEPLEDRTAPAVLTVNSTLDTANPTDGYLSLREAIAIVNNPSPTLPSDLNPAQVAQISGTLHANQKDTIQSSVSGPIPSFGLELSLPSTTATITIDGGTGVTVNPNYAGGGFWVDNAGFQGGGILTIDPGVSAQLKAMTLANGQGNWGGAIANYGSLTLTNCILTGNVAIEEGQVVVNNGGGAIVNFGTIQAINSCQFLNNWAISDSPAYRGGGAILNFGNILAIQNGTTFDGNHAGKDPWGETDPNPASGGAIESLGGAVQITNTTLTNNTATGDGAAIALFGGTLDMSHSTVNGNRADHSGGGIWFDPAVATITACTFSGNTAPAGADLYNLDSSVTLISTNLNGVVNNNGGTITLIGSSISGLTGSGGTVTDPMANLLAQVAALDLSSGVINSLTSKLQAAEQSLSDTNTTAAVDQLDAFVNEVDALVNSHRLGELSADSLISEVDNVINVIG